MNACDRGYWSGLLFIEEWVRWGAIALSKTICENKDAQMRSQLQLSSQEGKQNRIRLVIWGVAFLEPKQ